MYLPEKYEKFVFDFTAKDFNGGRSFRTAVNRAVSQYSYSFPDGGPYTEVVVEGGEYIDFGPEKDDEKDEGDYPKVIKEIEVVGTQPVPVVYIWAAIGTIIFIVAVIGTVVFYFKRKNSCGDDEESSKPA